MCGRLACANNSKRLPASRLSFVVCEFALPFFLTSSLSTSLSSLFPSHSHGASPEATQTFPLSFPCLDIWGHPMLPKQHASFLSLMSAKTLTTRYMVSHCLTNPKVHAWTRYLVSSDIVDSWTFCGLQVLNIPVLQSSAAQSHTRQVVGLIA